MEIESMIFARDWTVNEGGTTNLLGMFSAILVSGPPYIRTTPMIIYTDLGIEASEAGTTYGLKLDVVHDGSGESVGSLTQDYPVHSLGDWARFPEFHFIFRIREVSFPSLGAYRFNLYVDSAFKRSRLLWVHSKEKEDEIPDGSKFARYL